MKFICFDIESIPQNEELLLARAPDFKPAANLKDPDKIAASISEKRNRYIADAALDWKTAEVVLIGCGDGESFTPIYGDEKETIREFLTLIHSALCDGCMVGGHNVKGFDLPMIINRARVHGLKIPDGILTMWKGRSQWADNIFDTLEILTFGNKQDISGNGVDAVAATFGLPAKTGHGSDFPVMWKQNQDEAISYNRRDVEIEIEIARMCGVI